MIKFEPADIIAGIIVIGCLALMSLGINHTVQWLITGVAIYYFGMRHKEIRAKKSE